MNLGAATTFRVGESETPVLLSSDINVASIGCSCVFSFETKKETLIDEGDKRAVFSGLIRSWLGLFLKFSFLTSPKTKMKKDFDPVLSFLK